MKKILVIEDENALRKDIIEMLNYEGYQMIGAENGAVGVEKAREHLPDLIICDIMMPELDGYEVLNELRKETETATIPFIFLTAKTDKVERRLGMEQGADDYLTKPFSVAELLKSINVRLEKRAALEVLSEKRLDQLRDNIAHAVPHELRTPLTLIMGFSDLLLDDPEIDLKHGREMVETIHSAAQRLHRLIENYLVYAQIEIAESQPAMIENLRQGSVNNPHTIIEALAQARAQSYDRLTDLSLNLSPAAHLQVSESNFRKIVDELVDNAFKFSDGANQTVRVTSTVESNHYVLTVTNQGRGMTADQIRKIGAYMQFNRQIFEQQGSGLGLIVARRLAQLHNGSLDIASVPDGATTVTVRLPLA